jgi:predicted Fe-S protein YdhL (DUF1289 family)
MTAPAASPCINICQMDETSGLCSGCLRTLDEIAFWSVLDEEDKRQVWRQLEARRIQAVQALQVLQAQPASKP